MIKKIIVIFLGLLLFSEGIAQVNTFGEETGTEKEWFFALRLMPNLNGNLIQTAIIRQDPDMKKDIQFVPLDDWIRQIVGIEISKANPEKENLIRKYNVFDIPGEKDNEDIKKYTLERTKVILTNLWRLKYSEYPFFNPEMNREKGWAKNPDSKITWMPSESQIQLLKPYGINNLSDFFIGEHLFDLLRDVTNRDWQNRYVQSAGVYHNEP